MLFREVIKEQDLNQRLGRDASFGYALCAVIERKLNAMNHKNNTKGQDE